MEVVEYRLSTNLFSKCLLVPQRSKLKTRIGKFYWPTSTRNRPREQVNSKTGQKPVSREVTMNETNNRIILSPTAVCCLFRAQYPV